MKKYSALVLSGLVLAFFGLTISSCKDDPKPVTYSLTFSKSTSTAIESDANIEIELKLDKPAPEDVTVDFELSGTAYDDVRAEAEDEYADFLIDGDYGEIEILKGESSAIITLIPLSDDAIEDSETIEIKLKSVSNTSVLFESTELTTVTLAQEDGVVISLTWPVSNTANGFVDMDLFLRIGETTSTWDGILTGSVYRSTEITEYVFVPKAFTGSYFGLDYDNTTYGASYTYYDGTRENLTFTATFIDLVNEELEPVANRQAFTGNYTKTANANKWVGTTYPTAIAQTFRNVNGSFVEFSQIATPVSGSRTASPKNEFINQALQKYQRTSLSAEKVLPEKYKRQL